MYLGGFLFLYFKNEKGKFTRTCFVVVFNVFAVLLCNSLKVMPHNLYTFLYPLLPAVWELLQIFQTLWKNSVCGKCNLSWEWYTPVTSVWGKKGTHTFFFLFGTFMFYLCIYPFGCSIWVDWWDLIPVAPMEMYQSSYWDFLSDYEVYVVWLDCKLKLNKKNRRFRMIFCMLVYLCVCVCVCVLHVGLCGGEWGLKQGWLLAL